MEFQVSARKWRPQKFAELIGQEHIVQTLVNAITLERVAHAYLFSGTRGVGKTTTARIFAKALNCQNPQASEPCDECTHCVEIRQGSSLDVQEIDGASNNGVAEVRELIENIQYAASSCQYRVYIIDEVHMLSKNAFNALLKTLEEPPEKVVFIFATTEQNKIPETILSRCQCFEFKPLTHQQIVRQLDLIVKNDGIEMDRRSLDEIAKNGSGSMRDAQSLLDQVIAFSGKKVEPGSVESVLGIVGQKALESFIDTLIAGDSAGLIDQVQEIANTGKDLTTFCRDLVGYTRNLMMAQVAKDPEKILDSATSDLKVLKKQSRAMDPDQWQQTFTVLQRTEADMKRSSMARAVFEMALLRLLGVRPCNNIDGLISAINEAETEAGTQVQTQTSLSATPKPTANPEKKTPAEPAPETNVQKASSPIPETEPVASAPQPAVAVSEAEGGVSSADWGRIKQEISGKKSYFAHYLMVCDLVELNDKVIHLRVMDPYTKELIEKEENISVIRAGVQSVCKRDVKVQLSLSTSDDERPAGDNKAEKKTPDGYNNKSKIAESEIIQEALEIFGGVVTR
ncbi:DNA polymerase III subunits gamma and tau [hydrothermal vent metagenome]|uniref:DNA-directed DNA polymerase n=1 Tax=hydrothermal vent metagenome TaxID=652676 RepID=A0A3B1D8A0_9ZZZZ